MVDELANFRLKDVARLDLKPGDSLVVTVPDATSAQMAHDIRERIAATLGDRWTGKVLVLPESMHVSIVSDPNGEPTE